LADALHFLLGKDEVSAQVTSSVASVVLWAAMLGLPMLIGARHLYLLLRR